jgi:hypothetical protein
LMLWLPTASWLVLKLKPETGPLLSTVKPS